MDAATPVNPLTQSVGFNVRTVAVTQIDTVQGVALAMDTTQRTQVSLPLYVSRAPGRMPRVGEIWYVDQSLGFWAFAALVGSTTSPAFSDQYSVRDFGAQGDGTNDDSPAFQAALKAVAANSAGAHLVIPPGIYLLKSEIEISGSVWIRAMPGATIKRGASTMNYILKNFNSSTTATLYSGVGRIRITGGTWDCDGGNLTGSCTAMAFVHAKGLVVEDATIRNVRDLHGVKIASCQDVVIDHCVFEGFNVVDSSRWASAAVGMDPPRDNGTLPGLASAAYDERPCDNVVVSRNTVRGLGSLGSYGRLFGTDIFHDTFFHTKIRIFKNYGVNLSGYAIQFIYARDAIVEGNSFSQSNGGVRYNVPSGATLSSESVVIIGNTFRDMGTTNGNPSGAVQAVISLAGLTSPSSMPLRQAVVSGNIVVNYANSNGINVQNCADAEIAGNVLKSGTGSGATAILVNGSVNSVISNNKINTVAQGIWVEDSGVSDSGNAMVDGNNVHDCTTVGIQADSQAASIINNKLRACGNASIYSVEITGSRCLFQGNYIWKSNGAGIKALHIGSGATEVAVMANYFRGWPKAGTNPVATDFILDNGSSTFISATEMYTITN